MSADTWLAGRAAVVVGGGSGIGRGTSLGLAAAGCDLMVADIEADAANAVTAQIVGAGGTAVAHPVDGTDRESLAALRDAALERFGAVHVVSNNVGVLINRPLADADETEWAWAVEFNLLSIVRSVDVFLPALRANAPADDETTARHSHIVNTASMAALFAPSPQQVAGVDLGLYVATKHAILGYCEVLRGELADDGIGVSVLCPGLVESNLAATSARNRPDRHGGAFEVPEQSRSMPGAMTQEDVGPVVVAGIEGDRLHVLTHPESRGLVERRHQVLLEDYAYFAAAAAGRDESGAGDGETTSNTHD